MKDIKVLSLIFVLALGCYPSYAQFKNILLDPANAYKPSIAINPDDSQNIVAVSSPGTIYYTFNAGNSWEKAKVSSAAGALDGVKVISDFKGNFYCFYQLMYSTDSSSQLAVQESTDGGRTWSEAALINDSPSKFIANPSPVVDRKGNFYVTWTEFEHFKSDTTPCESRILMSRSSNGKKWSKPLLASQTSGNCKGDDNTVMGATPAVMGGGERAFVSWANQEKIFFDRSFNGGDTWLLNDMAVADQPGGWSMKIPGLGESNGMPVLLCNNEKKSAMSGMIYLTWADQRNGEQDADIWFTRSWAFGDTWSPPIRINNDSINTHQYLPGMALDPSNGNLYIIYYDRRSYDNFQTDLYLAYSSDDGVSFKNVKITQKPFVQEATNSFADHIGISASNGMITPIWTQTDAGKRNIWTTVIKQADLEKLK